MITKKQLGMKRLVDGGITSPAGFKAAGIHAGLKHKRKDLGVIFSEKPAVAAAVYTTSHFQAAPIKVTKESISCEGKLQAVLVNSAVANACTGELGMKNALMMREAAAERFHLPNHYVAIASTGVIGQQLPIDKITTGVVQLEPEVEGATEFAEAILTTDLVTKTSCWQGIIDGKTVTIGGVAKGSGMIHPNMATMLAFITTDASIDHESLQSALRSVTDTSFNCITVDGETSTNDMVLVMANGAAENVQLNPNHPSWHEFIDMLQHVSEDLAKQIARDGEGATKLIEVEVRGAASAKEASIVARKIAGSDLVKTAMFGMDANWGRIIGAIGHSEASINPDHVDIAIGPIPILAGSEPLAFSETEARTYLESDTISISVHLNVGSSSGKAWGCDLSYGYVKINASYRT